jgi:dihydrofolate reductase
LTGHDDRDGAMTSLCPTGRYKGTERRLKEHTMGQVIANASMSLDGYIAKHDNTIGRLFEWLQNGEVEVPTIDDRITLHMSRPSAEYWRGWVDGLGALVCGRTLFDFTGGWDGMHTIGVPVVVVSHQIPTDWVQAHPEAPFSFVTDGVEAAVAKAQEIAGERTVAVTAGTIARQCLELGLLDAVAVDLVPVVMGHGRPFFGKLATDDAPLGDPITCVHGDRVTHLVFPVAQPSKQPLEGHG